jgi:hypothetical protein
MERTARVLTIVVRLCGGVALALGLIFWLGCGRTLTWLHIAVGIGLVLSIWALIEVAHVAMGIVAIWIANRLLRSVPGAAANTPV